MWWHNNHTANYTDSERSSQSYTYNSNYNNDDNSSASCGPSFDAPLQSQLIPWYPQRLFMVFLSPSKANIKSVHNHFPPLPLHNYPTARLYILGAAATNVIYKTSTQSTGSFEMTVGVLTTCHLVLQMQPHVISFYGVMSRIRFMFLLFPQVSRNWRYESELPLKPSPLTCYKQFGMNSIIMLMFVESQRVHT